MQQEKALAFLKAGYSVFLTGSAGTGKTYVLNQYISYLKERKVPVGVTASTGIAATHLNGMTIHSWSGIGIKDHLGMGDLSSMKDKKYLRTHLEAVKVLIIDEVSMLHGRQLNMVNQVLKYFKDSSDPFGGIQVVFCGDFYQLPPIGSQGEENKDKFAFMSASWNELRPVICYLQDQFRQNDNILNQLLMNIRSGEIDYDLMETLQSTFYHESTDDATRLYTHNADVDRINNEKLENLRGDMRLFRAKTKGNPRMVESLTKAVLTEVELALKVGAKVMFVKNNPEIGVVNGSIGEITEFDQEGNPLVKLVEGKTVPARPETWSVDDDSGKPIAQFIQIPLRLAWAITVHKCQGMTLDEAEIDLSKVFEKGQGYVALSRLKDIKNLRLLGFNQRALEVDDLAARADKRLMILSGEHDIQIPLYDLEKRFAPFLRGCGGLVDKEEIEKSKKKAEAKKTGKSTFELTRELVMEHLSLDEIVHSRGLVKSTIIGHLLKLKDKNPDLDLTIYKPAPETLNLIQEAANQIREELGKPMPPTELNSKDIRDRCNNLDYSEVKLGLLFVD
jgi:GTPase SAR1 family protein